MPADGPKVVPASTVVIFRSPRSGTAPELLMVQRAREMRFAGGATVFPGGRVDPADRDLAAALMPGDPIELAAARIAGIRETLEETGLMIATREAVNPDEAVAARRMLHECGELAPVLEHFGWHIETGSLTLFAHWCPPMDRAFDTRFFVHDLGTGAVDVTVDATENTRLFWASAAQALEMADSGQISVIFPTMRNLERLALFGSHAEVLDHIARYPVRRLSADMVTRDGADWLTIPEGHGYPVLGQPMATANRGQSGGTSGKKQKSL
jgi:8-oxo-dGTP pyrophosphatase MutT (NUDIX family)